MATEVRLFNSLKYAKILEGAGLPRNQAETHVQILGDLIGEEMATKEDIKLLAHATRADVEQLAQSTKADVKQLAQSTKSDMEQLAQSIKADMEQLAQSTKADMEQLAQSTKADIEELARSTGQESKLLREDFNRFDSQFNSKLAYEIQSLEYRMALKLGGLMAAFLATGLTAAKLFLI